MTKKRAPAKHALPETVTVKDAAGDSHEIPPGFQLVEMTIGPNPNGDAHQAELAHAPDAKARAAIAERLTNPSEET